MKSLITSRIATNFYTNFLVERYLGGIQTTEGPLTKQLRASTKRGLQIIGLPLAVFWRSFFIFMPQFTGLMTVLETARLSLVVVVVINGTTSSMRIISLLH